MIYNRNNMQEDFERVALQAGKKLYENHRVTITHFQGFYYENSTDIVYEVHAKVQEDSKKVYEVQFLLQHSCISGERCFCSQNENRYVPFWDLARRRCRHIAATMFELMDYVQEHPECIETDWKMANMIIGYQKESIAKTMVSLDEKILLEPIIEKDGEEYRVLFKIGNKKKYVIKNLYDFVDAIQSGAQVAYGKDLEVVHHIDIFEEKSKELVTFIMAKVAETRTFLNEIDYYNYGRLPKKRHITLTPSVLDDFFQIMEGKTITIVDKEVESKKEGTKQIRLVRENPTIPVIIDRFCPSILFRANDYKKPKDFAGITVSVPIDGYIQGKQYAYVLMEDKLYKADEDFKYVMQSFLKTVGKKGSGDFIIGEFVAGFYQQVISKIRNYIDLQEYDHEEIAAALPPDPVFEIYLDKVEENVLCEVKVRYGEESYNIYDECKAHAKIGNQTEEFQLAAVLNRYLPYLDEKLMMNHCGNDDEVIYRLLDEGIEDLMQYGQVFISDALQRMKINTSPKISVGVSINHNLLDLTIDSSEIDFQELQEILSSYRMKKRYHRLNNGNFLQLEENSLTALSELMESMHLSVKDLTKGKLQIPAYRALYLDKILQESEGIHYARDKKVKEMLRNFKAIEESEFEIPKELEEILRPYQKVGYQWLRTVEAYQFGGILADDMGLGKTVQMIAVLLAAKLEGKEGTSLIVCPSSLIYNWENECHQFAPTLQVKVVAGTVEERINLLRDVKDEKEKVDVLITSYDLLKRDIDQYDAIPFLYEIIDEAQYIKNQTTQGAKAVKIINAKTRFALTGTPIENRLSELWSIFDYLMPGFLYRYEQFKKEMEVPITKRQEEDITVRLKKMVAPFILRRLKKDVLKDLPDKLEQVTYAKMAKEQRSIYEAYVKKIRVGLAGQSEEEFASSKLKILSELTRLRQICCDPTLLYENYEEESAKLATCMELLHNAVDGNHKVLLFSQFTSMLSIIEERLTQEGITYYKITGATKKEERIQLVNKFNEDDTTVFLISLKAGGTGLNLTGADIVIHFDPWWNVAAQNQATDRAHRIGQKNVVTVFKLIMQDTIEEKIMKMQLAKKDLADQIISEDTNQLQNMTREDFEELLG